MSSRPDPPDPGRTYRTGSYAVAITYIISGVAITTALIIGSYR